MAPKGRRMVSRGGRIAACAAGLACWLAAMELRAGDHTDSHSTRAHQTADLADVYVFPVEPRAPGTGPRLVVILTAFSNASAPTPPSPVKVPAKQPGTRFSDHVDYVFRLRPAELRGSGAQLQVSTDGSRELRVTCTFDDAMLQRVTCATSRPEAGSGQGLVAEAAVDDPAGSPPGPVRVFAGVRADPFFTDPGKLLYNYLKLPQLVSGIVQGRLMQEAEKSGLLAAAERGALQRILERIPEEPEFEVIRRPRDRDIDWWSWPGFLAAALRGEAQWLPLPTAFIRDANVLGIVVELDLAAAYGGPVDQELFAVAAETWKAGHRIDRDARPTLLNLLFIHSIPYPLAEKVAPDLVELQDTWNRDDTFALDPRSVPAYRAALQKGMTLYDGADGAADWPDPHPMMAVMMTDALLVDVTRPVVPSSAEPSYLEIEMARFQGRTPRTGGGRKLNDDAIDTFLSWFINGPERFDNPRRTDGEDRPSAPAVDEFPYLRPPHGSQ